MISGLPRAQSAEWGLPTLPPFLPILAGRIAGIAIDAPTTVATMAMVPALAIMVALAVLPLGAAQDAQKVVLGGIHLGLLLVERSSLKVP